METVTISPKLQVVIPQKIREAMGLRSGEKAKVVALRNRIEIIPMREVRSLREYLKGIDTSFTRDGDRRIHQEEIRGGSYDGSGIQSLIARAAGILFGPSKG